VDRRLSSAQSAMMLHEETGRRADRERCQLVERVDAMERSLVAADNDKRLLEVAYSRPVASLPRQSAPGRRSEYFDVCVCVCVCVSASMSPTDVVAASSLSTVRRLLKRFLFKQ